MLVKSTFEIEDILNVDGISLDHAQIVGRITDLNFKISHTMTGELPYKELTIIDSTGQIFIQIF